MRPLIAFAVALSLQLAGTAPANAAPAGPDGSAERIAVTDPRSLLLSALDSPDGSAHGQLVGVQADAIARRFEASGPILLDVTTLRRLPTPGCARLNLRFFQRGVRLPGEAPGDRSADIGLNLCRDGHPPPAPAVPADPARSAP